MALADVLGSMGVRGVRLTDALVRVSSTGPDEFVIRAILRLEAGNGAGPSQLVVTAPWSRLDVLTVANSAGRVTEGPKSPNSAASLLLLDLDAGKTWDGAEIDAVYRWRPGRDLEGHFTGPRALVLPHGLHMVRSDTARDTPSSPSGQPQPRLQLDDATDGVDIWGVPTSLSPASGTGVTSLLQAVLFERPSRHPAMGPAGRDLVTVSPTLHEHLTSAEIREVVHEVTRALSFFGDWFGTGIPCSILLVHSLDTVGLGLHPPGPLILGVPGDKAPMNATTPAPAEHLAFWAAGTWCGAGFQLSGPNGPEIMGGLRQALTLEWLRASDPVRYQRAYRTYSKALNRSWLRTVTRDFRAFLDNHSRPTAKDYISIALSDGFAHDSTLAKWLAVYVREHWGRSIDSCVFLRELAARGITFPRGVLRRD